MLESAEPFMSSYSNPTFIVSILNTIGKVTANALLHCTLRLLEPNFVSTLYFVYWEEKLMFHITDE